MMGPRMFLRDHTLDIRMMAEKGLIETNGALSPVDGVIDINFRQPEQSDLDVFQVVLPSQQVGLCNGLTVKFRLENWSYLKYVAIGYELDGRYVHVKIPHVRQGHWLDFSVSHEDLAFLLQNKWERREPCSFPRIKVFIKGVPCKDSEGLLSLSNVGVWLTEMVGGDIYGDCEHNAELVELLENYWFNCFPDYQVKVDKWLKAGRFPSAGASLPWPIDSEKPVNQSSNPTLRYMWHAFSAVSMLLLSAGRDQNVSSLFSAREVVSLWLGQSYFQYDKDQKYAWYDHGTAERALAMVGLWEYGLKLRFDHRFMSQLKDAIIEHGRLLASESFYASHQSHRYHNHAWFQDVGLLAVSVALSGLEWCEEWTGIAIDRLTDQLSNLVINDSGYAIFIENSIGYHRGVERLVTLAGKLAKLAGASGGLSDIAKDFCHWSQEFSYPDGRSPAQGDTFRVPNPKLASEISSQENDRLWRAGFVSLPKAGYMVAKGGNESSPWMLSMLGTNLNSTHKHEDDLSLTFWMDGVEWLIDPSFYSHDYNDELPAFLRSASAHNVLCLPGYHYDYHPKENRVELSGEQNDSGAIIIHGTNRSYSGIDINRSVMIERLEEPVSLSVEDSLKFNSCEKSKEKIISDACVVLHFGDGVEVKLGEGCALELSHPVASCQLILKFEGVKTEDVELVSSVSGLGFTETLTTSLIRVPLGLNGKCKWTLNVK